MNRESFIDKMCTYRLQTDSLANTTIQPLVTGTFVIWKEKNIFDINLNSKIESLIPDDQANDRMNDRVNDLKLIIEELKHMDLRDVYSIIIFNRSNDETKILIKIDRWFYQQCYYESRVNLRDMHIRYDPGNLQALRRQATLVVRPGKPKLTNRLYLLGGIGIALLIIPLYFYYYR